LIVVSDTSPLSYLHLIGRLELLRLLYGKVVIPPAVDKEIRSAERLHEKLDRSFIEVVGPRDKEKVTELLSEIDRGESEAIVLALELGADLLLIDEATGRDVAARLGLRRIGLLGIFLEAKRRNIIQMVSSEVESLVKQTNFRIRSEVLAEVLRLSGESR
jgi:predicted nucleic acid-binding protein